MSSIGSANNTFNRCFNQCRSARAEAGASRPDWQAPVFEENEPETSDVPQKKFTSRLKSWLVKGLVIVAGAVAARYLLKGNTIWEKAQGLLSTVTNGFKKLYNYFSPAAKKAAV